MSSNCSLLSSLTPSSRQASAKGAPALLTTFAWRSCLLVGGLLVCWFGTGAGQLRAENGPAQQAAHPLDPALQVAREGLDHIKQNVKDYTCTIIKRERIKGELTDHQFMAAKIRQRQEQAGRVTTPFSVYMRFLKPASVAGREVIWVEGRNNGSLIAHEAGLLNFKRVSLAPDGFVAMMGQRYPISKIGVQNLIEELLVKGERDRKYGECEVKFFEDALINKRPCRMIQVMHPVKREHFDFYKAQIFIDKELKIPVRYAAWSWPEQPGGEPVLEEEYTYVDVKLNVGLDDTDFDPDNPDYNYPSL